MRVPVTLILILAGAAFGCSKAASPTSPTSGVLDLQVSASSELDSAAAQTVPFTGSFEGTFTTAGEPPIISVHVVAGGQASHLGRFTLDFPHTASFIDFTSSGSAVLTAANGDRLLTNVTGVATPGTVPGELVIVETHEITGGTGRFDGASGEFTLERTASLTGPTGGTTSGSFEGRLSRTGSH